MQGLKKYNIPVVLVMTADTLNVVDINRSLVKVYNQEPNPSDKYDARVQKLFARHIKPQEQADALSQKHWNAKEHRVLNVYVGTPNRLVKLAQMGAFDMAKGDRFRLMVIDGRINKK